MASDAENVSILGRHHVVSQSWNYFSLVMLVIAYEQIYDSMSRVLIQA